MITTVRNWFRNAGDRLDLMWTEPLSWVVIAAAAAWMAIDYRRAGKATLRTLAIGGLGLWLVAALAVTIYPIDGELAGPSWDRVELKSFIPLWGLIDGIAASDGYILDEAEWMAQRQRIAVEMEIPVEEVNLDRRFHGPGLGVVLKDPIGNIVLFLPLGWLVALGWKDKRRLKSAWLVGVAVSTGIELSQMLFGLGSLGTIDDVIFNSVGAAIGYLLWAGGMRLVHGDTESRVAAIS